MIGKKQNGMRYSEVGAKTRSSDRATRKTTVSKGIRSAQSPEYQKKFADAKVRRQAANNEKKLARQDKKTVRIQRQAAKQRKQNQISAEATKLGYDGPVISLNRDERPRTAVSRNEKRTIYFASEVEDKWGHTNGDWYKTQEKAFGDAAHYYRSIIYQMGELHRSSSDVETFVNVFVVKDHGSWADSEGIFCSRDSEIDRHTVQYIEDVLLGKGLLGEDYEDRPSALIRLDIYRESSKISHLDYNYDQLRRHEIIGDALAQMYDKSVVGVRAYVPYNVPELKDIGFTIVKYGKSIPKKP